MNANELRVGNLIQTEYEGVLEVININSEGFDYVDCKKPTFKAIGRHGIESISPIPITEEWLLRFGFEKDGPGWYWLNAKDRFTDLGYSYNLTTNVFEFDNCDLPEVYFVHQLQNLFWALCGQELTIKEAEK